MVRPMNFPNSSPQCLPTLAVIDAENLDRARILSGLTPRLGQRWRQVMPAHPQLTTYVGSDASRFGAMVREFPNDERVVGFGPDGGELALIDVIKDQLLDGQFGCLVIGSGDGEFVNVAWKASTLGLLVVVVALDDCLSTRLARIAHHTISFPEVSAVNARDIPSTAPARNAA
jgi:hypothetical protein